MNYKLIFFIFYLFASLIVIQTNEAFDLQPDTDLMNEISSIVREARSFGCNGPNDKSPYRCKLHCRNRMYKSGRCTKASNYTRCQCYTSSNSKS